MDLLAIDWTRVGAVAGAIGAVVGVLGKLRDLRRRAERAREEIAQEALEEAARRASGASPFGEASTALRALQEARVRIVELERDGARLHVQFQESLLQRVRIERENESLRNRLTSIESDMELRDITRRHLERQIRDLEYQLGDALAVETDSSRPPKPVST